MATAGDADAARWRVESAADTEALARGLAAALARGGAVIGLVGPLGAGKTVFAKGLAAGLGIDPGLLASPTFVIAGELPLPPGAPAEVLVHADFYRVEADEELELAGLADWLAPGTLLLAEWADRFPEALPADRLEVRIAPGAGGPEARELAARAAGPGSRETLRRWRQRCP